MLGLAITRPTPFTKFEMHSFVHSEDTTGVPKFKGRVTLITPLSGVVCYPLVINCCDKLIYQT